jgi:hypothetical protein
MSWQDMIEGTSGLAAISALASPQSINPGSKSPLRLPASDEINLINAGAHSGFPSRRIVRNMRDAHRLRYQMNPPATKMNDAGAQLVSYGGGYFKAWYIVDGVVNYLPEIFDTQSRAKEAAENARQRRVSLQASA